MERVSRTLWSVIMIPIPISFNFLIISIISVIEMGSIPENGSSSMRNLGLAAIALAISTFLLSPPESDVALDFLTWYRKKEFSNFSKDSSISC